MFLALILVSLLLQLSTITGRYQELEWAVQEGTTISYHWIYQGNPLPESSHKYNFSYEGEFKIVIVEIDSLENYSRTSSIGYRIENISTTPYGLLPYHLHPLPIGNWSYLKMVYQPNLDTTFTETLAYLTANYTLGYPYSNIPESYEFQYSKTDGVVERAITCWYNMTTNEQIFYSEVVRLHENNMTPTFVSFVILAVIITTIVVIVMKRRK